MALRLLSKRQLRLDHLKSLGSGLKTFATCTHKYAKVQQSDEVNEEPIKFFGSQAGSWRAKSSRSGGADESLWYQPYVISGSLAAFLIYFCVLREENDIDEKLGKSLFDHIDGLEEQQLVIMYKYNRDNGVDNSQIVARLKELNIDVRDVVE